MDNRPEQAVDVTTINQVKISNALAADNDVTEVENTTAAESRIRDTDMSSAMVEYSNNSIIKQAATSMLSQANQQPSTVLHLLNQL